MTKEKQKDGGYYAIKGFVFQFDKSLLEILANPTVPVEIEYREDLTVNEHFIQVKHKEAANYADSKVRPAVMQLLEASKANAHGKYVLYCHFKDRAAEMKSLSGQELTDILGAKDMGFTKSEKDSFRSRFILEFAPDFEKQFHALIRKIRKEFSLKSDEEAVVHHAAFRACLEGVAMRKKPASRKVTLSELKKLREKNEKIVFEGVYARLLSKKKYLSLIRQEYFILKRVNLANKERLFVVSVDGQANDSDLQQVVTNLATRFHKRNTSAQPYICFTGIDAARESRLKQRLWDKGIRFHDGSHFDGDKFRLGDLLAADLGNANVTVKVVPSSRLDELVKSEQMEEVFEFRLADASTPHDSKALPSAKLFYLQQTRDVITLTK